MRNLSRNFGIMTGAMTLVAVVGFVVVLVAPDVVGIGRAAGGIGSSGEGVDSLDQGSALIFLATTAVILAIATFVQYWVFDLLKGLPERPRLADRMVEANAIMAHASSVMTGMSSDVSATATLLTSGVLAQATVAEVRDTGTMVNFEPLVELQLLVELDGRPSYRVTKQLVLSPLHLAAVQPGARLAVRVAPTDDQQVAIDWSLRGSPA